VEKFYKDLVNLVFLEILAKITGIRKRKGGEEYGR